MGLYQLANYDCAVRGVATDTAPAGPYRGVARPASVFAMESVMDSAARELNLSGEQIRRRNFWMSTWSTTRTRTCPPAACWTT